MRARNRKQLCDLYRIKITFTITVDIRLTLIDTVLIVSGISTDWYFAQ